MKKYRRQSFISRSASSEATMSCDEERRGIPGLYADLSLMLRACHTTILHIMDNFYR